MSHHELSTAKAREMGRKKTKVKAITAQKNGEKGGRPRTRSEPKTIHPVTR